MTAACMIRFVGKAKDLSRFLAELSEKIGKLQKEEKENDRKKEEH